VLLGSIPRGTRVNFPYAAATMESVLGTCVGCRPCAAAAAAACCCCCVLLGQCQTVLCMVWAQHPLHPLQLLLVLLLQEGANMGYWVAFLYIFHGGVILEACEWVKFCAAAAVCCWERVRQGFPWYEHNTPCSYCSCCWCSAYAGGSVVDASGSSLPLTF
jgi:hypothetical protein